jgi:hypothetical protein
MARFSSRHIVVSFVDNAGHTLVAGPGPGNFQVDGIEEANSEAIEARDRHAHDGLFYGAELTQAWSLEVELRNQVVTHAAQQRILDFVRKTGLAATYTSVDTVVWAFKGIVTMTDGGVVTVVTLPKVRAKATFAEAGVGAPAKFSISGTNFVLPTYS